MNTLPVFTSDSFKGGFKMGLLRYFFLGVKLLISTESALKCLLIKLEYCLIWFQYNIIFSTLLGNVQGLNLNFYH